ncbi:hypothetical protein NFI96_025326, partial [Prochilodus magdalenae]
SEECPASSTRSPNIGITAQNGSQVAAVVLIGSTVHGDVNVTTGPGSTAEYKEFIVKAYETVEEYNSLPGEFIFLNERYVDLLMIQKHREVKERQQELCSKGQKLQKVLNSRDGDEYQRTSTHQLFSPDGRGCVPKAVLLQGNSGSGKSFTVQKILLDWSSGSLYPDQFDFVFHLKCKELNEEEGHQACTGSLRSWGSLHLEKGVEEYFLRKFFKDEKEASLQEGALECVKTNQNLFTACFIPVICWIHLHVPQTKDPKRS